MIAPYITLEKIQQYLPSAKLSEVSEACLTKPLVTISTDSRTIKEDDFFIALCGDSFDGNRFLNEVFSKGAFAALASDQTQTVIKRPLMIVENTLTAMQQIAKSWRQELQTKVSVVTGSNGKTTVKEMIAAIFKQALGSDLVLATTGNLNNEIGLPLTLLKLHRHHQLAVLEIGMNHPGETSFLAQIACPNIALINNAQREHQEFMHTVQAVALEHGAVIKSLDPDGIAIFPADSEYTPIWRDLAGQRTTYEFELGTLQNPSQADIHGFWAQDGKLTICFRPMSGASSENTVQVQLKTLGDHNAKNALAAAAVAYAAGIELSAIQEGLEGFKPVSGRMCEHHLPSIYGQGRMIDDTYNANPDSVLAAIEVLRTMPGQRWLVLGDMGEVGNQGVQFHQEIGSYAQRQGIDRVYVTGDLCKHVVEGFQTSLGSTREVASQQAIYSNNMPDLLKRLQDDLQSSKEMDSISILVKGSRFTKMERVVQALLAGESSCC